MQKKIIKKYLTVTFFFMVMRGVVGCFFLTSSLNAAGIGKPVPTPDEIAIEQRKEMISLLKDILESVKKGGYFTEDLVKSRIPPQQSENSEVTSSESSN